MEKIVQNCAINVEKENKSHFRPYFILYFKMNFLKL